jgi:hypothetical protein
LYRYISVQIEYPESLRLLLSGFSFFNLNMELIHPECSMEGWNFSKKWQVMSLMAGLYKLNPAESPAESS